MLTSGATERVRLYLKITGDQASVSGGEGALIEMVETWILEGAPE